MIVLDTDVLSHLQKRDPVGTLILGRLEASPDRDVRITAVTGYEMIGGAIALIDRRKRGGRGDLGPAFQLLQDLIEYLGAWRGLILPYGVTSEQIYAGFPPRLRQEIGDDARIAAIALASGALVWTCNVADYASVPGLDVVRAETGLRKT